jgi:acyl carrier protein
MAATPAGVHTEDTVVVTAAVGREWPGVAAPSLTLAEQVAISERRDPSAAAAATVALKWAAGLLTGTAVQSVRLVREPGRRPRARAGPHAVYVSLSHTAGLAVAAAARSPVGIDVERVRVVHEPTRLAGMLATMGAPPPGYAPTADLAVLSAWTRYEAVVKALGVGCIFPPRRFRVGTGGDVSLDGASVPLRVLNLPLPLPSVGHIGAVAGRLTGDLLVQELHPGDLADIGDIETPFPVPSALTTHYPAPRRQNPAMVAVLDKEKLRHTIAATLDVAVAQVRDEAHFMEDLGVDSLMAIELIVVLERSVGVKLDEGRLHEVTCLRRAYDLLTEQLWATT